MPKFILNKLVRDKIIEHQIERGQKPDYRQLSDDEHKAALVQKIIEEVTEITNSPADQIAAEIADVQQAIDDLVEKYGLDKQDIQKAQAKKNAKNGPFKKGLFIDSLVLEEGDEWNDYYRRDPKKFPEIK